MSNNNFRTGYDTTEILTKIVHTLNAFLKKCPIVAYRMYGRLTGTDVRDYWALAQLHDRNCFFDSFRQLVL